MRWSAWGQKIFYINTHLFPDEVQGTVREAQSLDQKAHFFHEEISLGTPKTLLNMKSHLNSPFLYLNADSLILPSGPHVFSEFVSKVSVTGMGGFFGTPAKNLSSSVFWVDSKRKLKFIGNGKEAKERGIHHLTPVKFSGLATFSQNVLDFIQPPSQTYLYRCFDTSS